MRLVGSFVIATAHCPASDGSSSVLPQVPAVEAEMRELLSEVAREKKAMETKFQRLSRAFQELQQDMS